MSQKTPAFRAWELAQQVEAALQQGNYTKVLALAEMGRLYSGMPTTDQDDYATVWFSYALSNPGGVTPNALTLNAEIVTTAAGAAAAEVTWLFTNDGSSNVVINRSITSNVATITFNGAHKLAVGQKITISGVGAPFDGTFDITVVPSSTTVSFALVNANVPAAVVSGLAKLNGLSITRDFVTPCQPFVTMIVDTAALLAQTYGAYVKVPYTAPTSL